MIEGEKDVNHHISSEFLANITHKTMNNFDTSYHELGTHSFFKASSNKYLPNQKRKS